ncbi:hypothetical protein SASPL_114275 [Salvia splendens]|uniref:Uncharacterized protein n=1 Tax=Salvia splendens TaxID=180675 RepID=A0A8X8Y0D2_SALSN|nr:hypothetical protein SASPL_114275 [Salvia splendens]
MASNDEICEPNPSDDGWVNPRRPLTRSPWWSAGSGGGGGKSLVVVQGKRKAQSFSTSRPPVVPSVESAEKAPVADATTPAVKKFKSGQLKLKDLKAVFQQISDHDAAAAGEDPCERDIYAPVEADTLNFSLASFIVPRGGLPFMHLSLMNCTICC